MVKQYISFPSTIILVTVPAEGAFLPLRAVAHSVVSLTMPSDSDSADDLENQKAMKLAKDADPLGEWTIGERPPHSFSILPKVLMSELSGRGRDKGRQDRSGGDGPTEAVARYIRGPREGAQAPPRLLRCSPAHRRGSRAEDHPHLSTRAGGARSTPSRPGRKSSCSLARLGLGGGPDPRLEPCPSEDAQRRVSCVS